MTKLNFITIFIFIIMFIIGCDGHKEDKSVDVVYGKEIKNAVDMEMVYLNKDYWVCKYETTQGQFAKVMGYNPSIQYGGNNYPVENLTQDEAMQFCLKITELELLRGKLPSGYVYSLPDFSQWKQYVADADLKKAIIGKSNKVLFNIISDREHTSPVGSGDVNRLGLADLRGNVSELSKERLSQGQYNIIYFGGNFDEFRSEFLNQYNICYTDSAREDLGFRCLIVLGSSGIIKNSKLHNVAWVGDGNGVRDVLESSNKSFLESTNIFGETPLHMAILSGDYETIKLLVDNGADLNVKTNIGAAPLHYACSPGNADIVKLLLESGAKEPDTLISGMNCMHMAVKSENVEVVKHLVSAGYKDNVSIGGTALVKAILVNRIDIAVEIIKGNVDLTIGDIYGLTPLMLASYIGWADGVKAMLEKGVDIHQKNDWGKTALHFAEKENHQDIVEMLLNSNQPEEAEE